MADSATIVAASLDSSQLEQSINKLVATVASKTKEMADNFTSEVARMEQAVKNLGNIKIDSGGAADGGSSRRAKLFSQEGEVIQRNNQIAKEYNTTLDLQAAAIRKASQVSVRTGDAGSIRNADTLQTMNIQLDLLRERLREARNQYSSFVALASHATTTGDKGLYQFATEGVHKYGDEVRTLIPQIRGLQNAIQQMGDVIAPQGHTIQNFVNSLQKTNPELAQLNEQFKKGQSELQNQSTSYSNATQSAHQYTEEIRKQAQAIRESQQWKEKGYAMIGDRVYYDPERSVAPAKNRLSLEEQILNVQKEEEVAAIRAANAQRQEAAEKAATEQEARKVLATEQQITAEQQKRSQPKTFASYDSLQESIAHVLGLQKQQVRLVDEETASYRNLDSALKQYRQAYNALTDSERKSDNGKMLIRRMQEISREIQKIQALSARPISLESIIGKSIGGARVNGLSEKTLDDIAYKMQRLASLRSGLNVETQQKEIRTVNQEYDRLKKKMDEVMQKNSNMIASNNALGRSWNYMKNRLAFYFTVGASTQFIKNLIEVRSQYEMNERALGILINSAERGTQIFNELSQMALVSPYTLIELSAAAKQLTAYDIAARDVVDTTRRLADMASAVGVPIERLTYALGQIKAYGYLNSRDARMFANAGIPLVKQLSDYYTELEGKMVSTADVYDRMKKKAIDYNSVMAVVTKMTDEGGKFFDFQAKMADTLKVRLANLTLAWNNMLNDMGKETQGVLTWSIGALRQLFLHWKNLDALIKDAAWILGIRTGFMLIAYAALKAGGALGITTRQMALSSVVGTKLAGVLGTLGRSIATIAKSPLTWWSLLALAAWDIFDAFVNADKATIEFNKSLRDSAKTTYEDLKKFAEQYKNVRDSLYATQKTAIGNIYDPSTGNAAATAYANQTVGQDISASEAKKVWEVMREQIELSSHASDEYISKLLSIENVSERLRQGFQILDDIQTVSAALKEIGEDGIKVTQSWAAWWNAWQGADGLIGNVKDLQKEIQRLQNASQDPNDKFTKVIDKDYATALERFRKDLKVTTDSVIDFINLNGWSGDTGKIDEVFKQVTDRLATQSNLDPQTAFTLQREVEVARAKAAKEALEIRIADEKKALATASDEISKQQIHKNLETLEQQKRDFDKFNGENRAYWNDFTKYIKERHISELTAAYNSMTDHGKKAMDFQSEEWQKRVHDWANRYEKSHNLATDSVFNRLRNWINDANTWSVFIKMTISTEDGKSVYKQLEEYDKAADDAWKTMQRLDKRISQLRKKGAKEVEGTETGVIDLSRVSQDDKELTEALKERTQAQKDYNDAVEKGGESKKENSAATKAQKAAESELAKALKDELKLIETVRSAYKDLTKDGASHTDAIEKSVSGYEKSVANINKVLEKYGIKLDLTKFVGIANPHELQEMFKQQLDALAGKAKPTEIQSLEVELQKVNLDVEKYDLTKITKGLNNELDKLKDEYELAVALDADPELGSMFASYMGVNLDELPRNAEQAAKKAQEYIDKILADNNSSEIIDISSLMDKNAFDDWIKTSGHNLEDGLVKVISAIRAYLIKVRTDETKSITQEWNKLLEKYAEYEYKVTHIQNEAEREREIARKKGASQDVFDAINNRERQEIARVGFEKFQKTPEWITATGDIASLTTSALNTLINSLENYKKEAKNLDPKQVERINKALRTMRKEVRKDNPFNIIANAMEEAKARGDVFDKEISDIEQKIAAISAKILKQISITGFADKDDVKTLEKYNKRLKELKETQSEVTKISFNEVNEQINAYLGIASNVANVLSQIASTVKDANMARSAELASDIVGNLQAAGQGFASGGWIGAVIGGITDLVPKIFKWASMEAEIDDSIKDSERAVKRLELAYIDLQQALDKAYGTATIGAKQATLANKELQLAEIQRQIQLEKSRSGKNRDEDKIIDLQKQYKELFYEIKNGYTEIVDDLMGTDVASFAENLVSSMIDAFKQGEDYMKVFSDKFDEMIDNMIMKSIVSRVVSQYLDQIWDSIDERINDRSKKESKDYDNAQNKLSSVRNMSDEELRMYMALERGGEILKEISKITQDDIDEYRKAAELEEKAAKERFDAATAFTGSDVDYVMERVTEVMPELGEKLKNILGEYYKFGESSETQLSALQQGLQGVSETTAGALEAYMNGVSQQVYYQSDLLTQIRDAVVGFNMDVQVASMSQILLQLRSSYEMQMAIHSMLEGWSSPNGMSVRVEMV